MTTVSTVIRRHKMAAICCVDNKYDDHESEIRLIKENENARWLYR